MAQHGLTALFVDQIASNGMREDYDDELKQDAVIVYVNLVSQHLQ